MKRKITQVSLIGVFALLLSTYMNAQNWSVYNSSNTGGALHKEVRDVSFDSKGNAWIVSNDGLYTWTGSLVKYDGTTWDKWTKSNSGIGSDNMLSVLVDHGDNVFIGTGDGGLYKYIKDNPKTTTFDNWISREPVLGGNSNTGVLYNWAVPTLAEDAQNYIWVGEGGGAHRFDGSTHNQATWDAQWFSKGKSVYGLGSTPVWFNDNVWDSYIAPNGDYWVACNAGSGTYKTSNNGSSWTCYNPKINGTSVISVTPSTSNQSGYVNDVYVDANGDVWMAAGPKMTSFGTPGGLLKLHNGTTWTWWHKGNSSLSSAQDYAEEVVGDPQGNIWVGTTDAGLFKFNPTANQWTNYNTSNSSLPSNFIWRLVPNYTTGDLWICTANGLAIFHCGFWNGVNVNDENSPKVKLYNNYPDPATDLTTFRFELKETANVSLRIMDVQGKEVAQLINEKRAKGENKITFDVSNLAKGVYFYELKTDNYLETKKMIVAH